MWCNNSGSKSSTNSSPDYRTSVLKRLLRSCAHKEGCLKVATPLKCTCTYAVARFTSMYNKDDVILFYFFLI